ncbi:MAG TPA: D-alanine--D-alanine ligase family protein [Pyrinomonadaceae bacterium]|nr:D-alanine--D-alanine ligase family protein [Pyrinomonadaceae bacterium]
MTDKIRIGIIFGGRSGEHEVSARSARAVIEAIDHDKYEVVPMAIAKNGKWLPPAESSILFPKSTQKLLSDGGASVRETRAVALIGDPTYQGLTLLGTINENSQPLDVVFPVLHGTYGEDGTIQGLFEMANIPYIGCGVLASSCGMDKVTMKTLFRDAGLPMCKYVWFLRNDFEREPQRFLDLVKNGLGFPAFVKPANLGSSVGVSRATDEESLRAAIELAARYDRKIIIEEGVDGREIEVAVMGNDEPQASLPGEYIIHDEAAKFLDYTEKYTGTGNNEFTVPAPLSSELTEQIQQMSKIAFKAVDGSGLARVDFFLTRGTGELLINEINTLPGLTEVSGFPKMWAATGKPFAEVIDELVALALARHADKARNQTSI